MNDRQAAHSSLALKEQKIALHFAHIQLSLAGRFSAAATQSLFLSSHDPEQRVSSSSVDTAANLARTFLLYAGSVGGKVRERRSLGVFNELSGLRCLKFIGRRRRNSVYAALAAFSRRPGPALHARSTRSLQIEYGLPSEM
jgi:hypothetical protein